MKNVLIIGATRPETIANPDGSNPITHLSGCAPAMAKTLLKGNQLRTTLLTALQRDQLGKATIRLLEGSGILYRAIDCEYQPPTRSPDVESTGTQNRKTPSDPL